MSTKGLEDILEETSKSKLAALGEMAGGIAHEINNPLAIIKSNAELLLMMDKRGKFSKEMAVAKAENICRTVDRILRVVNGLRSFARDGSDDEFETVQASYPIDNALDLCAEKFRNLGINIEVDVEEFDIKCKHIQLSQVVLNLINNAAHAALESNIDNPWIRIEAKVCVSNYACISVTDCGNGIDSSVAEKIFQPFFTTKKSGVGTGLGLGISKRIAEEHGGDLYLDTESKNTKFVFKLPLLNSNPGDL